MRIEKFVLTPFQQNSRVVSCDATQKAICIDPGEPSEKLCSYITDNGLDLQGIVLTHGHLDHVGGTLALSQAFPAAEILIHRDEEELYQRLPQQPLFMGIAPDQLAAMGMEYEVPPRPTRYVGDGDILEVGNLRFTIRHCPGHTLGHIVLAEETERVAFTGDCLFSGTIGRTDLPGGNYDRLLASINETIMCLDDDFAIHCGHGDETTVGRERQHNPFLTGVYRNVR